MEIISGKLFLIGYILGKVGLIVGPLPGGDIEFCKSFAVELANQCDPVKAQMTPYKCTDVKFVCEFHEESPILDPSFKDEEIE